MIHQQLICSLVEDALVNVVADAFSPLLFCFHLLLESGYLCKLWRCPILQETVISSVIYVNSHSGLSKNINNQKNAETLFMLSPKSRGYKVLCCNPGL